MHLPLSNLMLSVNTGIILPLWDWSQIGPVKAIIASGQVRVHHRLCFKMEGITLLMKALNEEVWHGWTGG